ncbi:MAG: MATE family efflux transporter [Bacteroidaceae bacterium]|nr:MATE family efflux transporter [Bacteroidaceae bacterium]
MNHELTKHVPTLLRLGLPIMVGQLGTIVMGLADTLMIGRHSTQELAAASFANNIVGLVIISAMGFSYGLTPVVGALLGEGKEELIGGKLKNALTANGLMGLLMMGLTGVLWLCLDHIGLPAEVVPLVRPYMLILILSILPQMFFNAYKQFSDGIQDTRTPMWLLLLGNGLNIVGNAVLIYGLFGAPELGLTGAGLATLMSRLFMWGAADLVFRTTRHYRQHKVQFAASHVHRSDLVQLSRLGIPVMLQMGMESASFALSAFYVGWLGTASLAAHNIMNTVGQLCFMLYYGMAAAVAVQVSYYRGAGNLPETKRVAQAGLYLTWAMALLITLPIFLLRHQIGPLFTSNSEVASLVAAVIPIFAVYQMGDALQSIYGNALRGMADVKPLIPMAFIAYFLISLPFGYLFGFVCGWGFLGVWSAFPFGLTSAGLMYWRRFNKK